MKKIHYIAPAISQEAICIQLLAGSPKGTNIDDLGVSDQPAPGDMEGHSRNFSVWDDEDEDDF